MSRLRYAKIKLKPIVFLELTRLSVEEFEFLVPELEKECYEFF